MKVAGMRGALLAAGMILLSAGSAWAQATLSVTVSSNTLTEGGQSATISATLTGITTDNTHLELDFGGGSAEAGDFSISGSSGDPANPNHRHFQWGPCNAGTNPACTSTTARTAVGAISFWANQDLDFDDETFTISMSIEGTNDGGVGVTAPSNEVITINDDDVQLTFSVTPTEVNEDSSDTGTITAAVSAGTLNNAATITVNATAGTAEAGDWTLSTNRTLNIAAGDTRSTGTVTIGTVDDADTGHETVTISGMATATGHNFLNTQAATFTVRDTDTPPAMAISMTANPVNEGQSTTISARITSGTTTAPTTVTVSAAAAGPNTTATDFDLSSTRTLSIAVGAAESTGNVTVSANQDADGNHETVALTFDVHNNLDGIATPAPITLFITDPQAPAGEPAPAPTDPGGEGPPAPTGLTVTPGDGVAVLSWQAPRGATITGWHYTQDNASTWSVVPGGGPNTTSHTVTGLTNGTEYTFRVRAVNDDGFGTASAAVSATPGSTTPVPALPGLALGLLAAGLLAGGARAVRRRFGGG